MCCFIDSRLSLLKAGSDVWRADRRKRPLLGGIRYHWRATFRPIRHKCCSKSDWQLLAGSAVSQSFTTQTLFQFSLCSKSALTSREAWLGREGMPLLLVALTSREAMIRKGGSAPPVPPPPREGVPLLLVSPIGELRELLYFQNWT